MRAIKDTDFLTSTMRVRCREKYLFDRERVERLIDARGDDEAIKVLNECGYGEMQSLSNAELDRVLGQFRGELYAFLEEILPFDGMLDVFRVRYDYHNVKSLLKTSSIEDEGRGLLVPSGRVPADELYRAFVESDFSGLPGELTEVILQARELLARTDDPQKADFFLDKACLEEMTALAKKTKSAFLTDYTRLYLDIQNLRALVRSWRIGKDSAFLRSALVLGGYVGTEGILLCLQENGSISQLYAGTPLSELSGEGEKVAKGDGVLTYFEKCCDNLLLEKVEENRHVSFGEQPVLAYLLLREAEMTMLRTVISGRLAGLSPGELREKLRLHYA
ncbi:MAG: V-type ATPase subunit [Oscillospiraceae bacterium]|nr:V-type ATPase subunit [Oscillospiraceae bacterium]